ncbi:hypothetical protein ACFVVX_23150 [Kitasatospora sp. NPDC058170]|uniref:hypothetical protein n=1 Tax=Kitasatospora sp. NPDC058170 TaxID=3346364 RepID=UPI0036D964D9
MKRRSSNRRNSNRRTTARRLLRTAAFAGVRGLAGSAGPIVVVVIKWWLDHH